jgi:hypothetical protein
MVAVKKFIVVVSEGGLVGDLMIKEITWDFADIFHNLGV